MEKQKLKVYSNVLDNLSKLKGLNLLPDERIDELIDLTDIKQFVPVELKCGGTIKNEEWKLHAPTNKVYIVSTYSSNYVRDLILQDLLSNDEIDLLNEHASKLYNKKGEKEKFDKAEKIHWRDFKINDKIILDDDQIFEDLESFVENYYSNNDPEDEDFEEWKPKYLEEGEKEPWLYRVGVDQIVENYSEDVSWDYSDPNITGEEELQKALDKFWEDNKNIWWGKATGRLIILDEEFWNKCGIRA